MLKYLMKYDLKKMLKLLIWFYALSIVLAGITRIFNIWDDILIIKIIGIVCSSLTYTAIANTLVNTFVHILMRFSTSFYKDHSYLTHTLPVTKDDLILSKFLCGLLVVFASIFVCFLSLFILFFSPEFMELIKTYLDALVVGFNMSSGTFVFLMIVILFAQICVMMSCAFLAMVKGYSYNHKRGVKGFLWFLVYYLSCSIITLLTAIVVSACTGNLDALFNNQMSNEALLIVIIVGLICYCVFAVAYYFLCRKEFKKGVNVD